MGIEGSPGHGSMYGVVDSVRNAADALSELLQHLPADSMWPTNVSVSPYSVYMEWGRDNSEQPMAVAVWLVASPEGVVMNSTLQSGWPCDALDFNAQLAADWLKELTQAWRWDADPSGGHCSTVLQRPAQSVV